MALNLKDTSEFRNFKDILNYYKFLFEEVLNTSDKSNKENHGANPFLPDKWEIPSNNEDATVQYVYNQGYNYLKELINTVEATKNGIHKGLRTLFINYDDPEEYWQEDMNYNLINAYAEASRSYEYYNKKTQNFEERPEYFWTRGNYYDMLPMCTAGKYLLPYKTAVENACAIMESYKTLFYNYNCEYAMMNSETDGIVLSYDMVNSTYAISTGENFGYGRSSRYNDQSSRNIYFYTSFWEKHLRPMINKVENTGSKNIKDMLKIGMETEYPEQTNDSEVIYTKKYYGTSVWDKMSIGTNGTDASKMKITNTKKMSNNCGTYKSSINVKENEA